MQARKEVTFISKSHTGFQLVLKYTDHIAQMDVSSFLRPNFRVLNLGVHFQRVR